MPARALRRLRANTDRGFTLIELLVVVLIIGALAAIAVPAFIQQQNQAKDASTKSDLGNAKKALASVINVSLADYDTLQAAFTDFGLVASPGTSGLRMMAGGTSNSWYCIEEQSASGSTFSITEDSGVVSGACSDDYPAEIWAYDYDA